MVSQRRIVQDSLDEAMAHHFDAALDSPDDFNILVTGFGPFKEQYPINPSYEIATRLPATISLPFYSSGFRKINLLVHQPAIRVNYDVVRLLTPHLYEGKRIDFTLHIGMAGSRNFYSIEDKAHITGYRAPDVDGDLCSYAWDGRKKRNEHFVSRQKVKHTTNEFGDKTDATVADGDDDASTEEYRFGVDEQVAEDWTSLPDVLRPSVDVMRVLRYWDRAMGRKEDVRVSEDAGRYLCEFIYWCSLAHREVQKGHGEEGDKSGKVLFLHVPGDANGLAINKGIDVVVGLCKAIAEVCEEDKNKINSHFKGAAEKKEPKKSLGEEVKEMFNGLNQLSEESKERLMRQLASDEADVYEQTKMSNEAESRDSKTGGKHLVIRTFEAEADGANDDYYSDSDAYDYDKWSDREDLVSGTGDKIEDDGIFLPYRKIGNDGLPLSPSKRGPKRKHVNRSGGKRYELKRQRETEAKTTAVEEGKKETGKGDEKLPFYHNIEHHNQAMNPVIEGAPLKSEKETAKTDEKVQKISEKKQGERIVIDKRYEGYILGIPFHAPLSK